MSVIEITDHVEQALDRRLEQWKEKPNMESFLRALLNGHQDLESTFFDLINRLDIFLSEGVQLDNIGKIVGQDRLGFDDDFYRILILARIGINISSGEAERIISTAKLLTKANYIHYMNLLNGEIAIGSDGVINPLSVEFLITNLQRVVMGGVRIDYLAIYDKTEAFAIAGTNVKTLGRGFGSTTDLATGGKLATLYTINKFFSFSGNNTNDGGFGAIKDPLVGGVLI